MCVVMSSSHPTTPAQPETGRGGKTGSLRSSLTTECNIRVDIVNLANTFCIRLVGPLSICGPNTVHSISRLVGHKPKCISHIEIA